MIQFGRLIGVLATALIAHSAQARGVELQAFATDETRTTSFAVLAALPIAGQSSPTPPVMVEMREWAFTPPLAEGQTAAEVVEDRKSVV